MAQTTEHHHQRIFCLNHSFQIDTCIYIFFVDRRTKKVCILAYQEKLNIIKLFLEESEYHDGRKCFKDTRTL